MLHDRYYHAARAAEERRAAMASANPKVRTVHLELAARYDALAEADSREGLQTTQAAQQQRTG